MLKDSYKLKHEEVLWAKLSKKFVLVMIKSLPGKNLYKPFFVINKTSVDILDCLLEYKKTQEIIKILEKKYHLSAKKAERDLKIFIEILEKNNLIS